jgi:hypothetical protein
MSKLVEGLIPSFKECPFKSECPLVSTCHHKGKFHDVGFSCGAARAFDMLKESK